MPVLGAQSVVGEAPLASGHEHATLADELQAAGDLTRAIEEHRIAAAEYLKSVEYTADANLQITLRRMHAEQVRTAEELERRLQRERDSSRARGGPKSPYGHLPPGDRSPSRTPLHSPRSSVFRLQDSAMSDRTSASTESYFYLGGDLNDAGERFNRFWSNVEAQLDQLTQPVAFAALPLSGEPPILDLEESATHSQYPPRASTSTIKGKGKARPELKVVPLDFDRDESSDSDSWSLVPPSNPPSRHGSAIRSTPSAAETRMKEDNEKLRAELEEVKNRLQGAEALIKTRQRQDAQLKDSIMIAKREAQRTLLQSTTMRQATLQSLAFTPISPGVPPMPDGASQGTQSPFMSPLPGPPSGTASPTAMTAMQRRIKDLEDENKRLNSENIKLSAQYTKLKEKWNNLKESAKKRRSMKEAQTPTLAEGLRGMSIKEEDEEELRESGLHRLPAGPLSLGKPSGGLHGAR